METVQVDERLRHTFTLSLGKVGGRSPRVRDLRLEKRNREFLGRRLRKGRSCLGLLRRIPEPKGSLPVETEWTTTEGTSCLLLVLMNKVSFTGFRQNRRVATILFSGVKRPKFFVCT